MMSLTRREFETVSRALLDAVSDDAMCAAPPSLPQRAARDLATPVRPVSGRAVPVH